MGLIEWREECDGLYGIVAGKRFFKLTKHSDMTFILVFSDIGTSYWESLEKAKAKAEELFTEWLTSAGLVQRPEWISVDDRLPVDMSGEYLFYEPFTSKPVYTMVLDGDIDRSITHWMPLPEPPK